MSKGHRSAIKRERNRAPAAPGTYTAVQRNARISPRKVRPAVELIRGRRVEEALDVLTFDKTRGSDLLMKVLQSAVANASSVAGADPMDLRVVRSAVDEAFTFRRWRARGRGRVGAIEKRNSHITVTVG